VQQIADNLTAAHANAMLENAKSSKKSKDSRKHRHRSQRDSAAVFEGADTLPAYEISLDYSGRETKTSRKEKEGRSSKKEHKSRKQ